LTEAPLAGTREEAGTGRSPRGRGLRALAARELLRIGLVPLFVGLCYLSEWRAWRALVTGAVLAILHRTGAPALPLSFDTFVFHGTIFQVAISCTALDVFFGSIPLLWQERRPASRNLLFLAEYFLCLSAINLARLVLGFLLYSHGVSWLLGHEMMSGVFYFAVLVWIAGRRGWSSDRTRSSS
jgi:hypothetical protein